MMPFFCDLSSNAIPIHVLLKTEVEIWLSAQPLFIQNWVNSQPSFLVQRKCLLLPGPIGTLSAVIQLVDEPNNLWSYAGLHHQLPPGDYYYSDLNPESLKLALLAWGLGAYQFNRYQSKANPCQVRLSLPKDYSDYQQLRASLEAIFLTRDLINTPAEDMGPEELAFATQGLAEAFKGRGQIIKGKALLEAGFPAIYAVGKGSEKAPALIDYRWGESHPFKLTLVGKGVCFDSGGLDLKPATAMRYMKKDMGGAAHVLGLAKWILMLGLPINLRVIIGAVENMVSGSSFRPGDIVSTRKGLSIEIGNTDAEGRVVLADCLTLAQEEPSDLIIDFATLTGASRVALGADIPSLFGSDEALVEQLKQLAIKAEDWLWPLPLYQPYRELIQSQFADLSNDSASPYGGAITAALFLKEFIDPDQKWLHIDLMAYNTKARPGRPEGGEAMGLRATFGLIAELCQFKK